MMRWILFDLYYRHLTECFPDRDNLDIFKSRVNSYINPLNCSVCLFLRLRNTTQWFSILSGSWTLYCVNKNGLALFNVFVSFEMLPMLIVLTFSLISSSCKYISFYNINGCLCFRINFFLSIHLKQGDNAAKTQGGANRKKVLLKESETQ